MDFIVLATLIIEVLVLSRLEKSVVITRITPFNVLAFPYAIVATFAFFLAPVFDFIPLSTGSLIVWMCGLFLVWMMGMLLGRGIFGSAVMRRVSEGLKSRFCGEASSGKLADWLGIAAIPILVYGLLRSVAAAGGWPAISSSEFTAAYSHGLPAHVIVLCAPLFVLLVGTANNKTRLRLAVAGILMTFFLLGQAKGAVLQPLVGGLFYRVMRGHSSISVKNIGVVVLCGMLAFGSVYLLGMGAADPGVVFNPDTYLFLGRYFSFYLVSGTLAFGEAISTGTKDVGGSPHAIFAPFQNVYNVVLGSGSLVINGSSKGKGVGIDLTENSPDHSSNVYTFFGTLYLYLGALGSIGYVTITALLSYLLLMVAAWTKNEWMLVLYCYLSAQLFFGFFEFYLWHLTIFEVTAYMICLAVLTSSVRKRPERGAALATGYFGQEPGLPP